MSSILGMKRHEWNIFFLLYFLAVVIEHIEHKQDRYKIHLLETVDSFSIVLK